MTVLDTFFILFKSNADEVEVATKRAQKTIREFGDQINDNKDKAKDLGLTFTDLVAAGIAAFGSIDIAGKLVQQAGNIIDLEVQLGRLSKLTDVSANEIDAWDAAVSRASGGPAGEFVGWLTKINQELVARGQGELTKNIIPNLLALADAWQGLSVAQKQFQGQKFELTPDLILLLDKGPQAIRDMIAEQKSLREATEEDTKSALELKNAWDNVGRSIQGAIAKALFHPVDAYKKILDKIYGEGAGDKSINAVKNIGNNGFLHYLGKATDPLGAFDKDEPSAKKPFESDTDGGIHIDGAAPPALPLRGGTVADGLDSQDLGLNDPAVRDTLNRAVGAPRHQQIMQDAANAISSAQSNPFASLPPAQNAGPTTILKIDKVEIHTQATDASGIAADFADKLHQQIGTAQSNAEDGILY